MSEVNYKYRVKYRSPRKGHQNNYFLLIPTTSENVCGHKTTGTKKKKNNMSAYQVAKEWQFFSPFFLLFSWKSMITRGEESLSFFGISHLMFFETFIDIRKKMELFE
jgi:hypothetical protein